MDDNARAVRILAAYPGAAQAVSFCELHFCYGPSLWPAIRAEARKRGLAAALESVRLCVRYGPSDRTLDACLHREGGYRGFLRSKRRQVLAELDTPDFRRYLAGRMGAV